MKKVLILANYDVGLYKTRKEVIEQLVKENQVYLSLPPGDYISLFKEMGCKFINTPIDRRGINPKKDFKLIIHYRKIIKKIKPDIVLTYTVKPNIYGGLICRFNNVKYMPNITGLGTALENKGWLQQLTINFYKIGLKKASCIFFQNKSNKEFFSDYNIRGRRTRLIPGSGVNLKEHRLEEYPSFDGTYRFLFVGRMMDAKGINELLEVAVKIKRNYPNVFFHLVGFCEENYKQKLSELEKKGIINYHGQQKDIHSFIKNSHAVILPSHHEGLANVLLESASAGRPVLASRIPGCIETYDEGVTGFGFEVRNVNSLEEAIQKFIELPYSEKIEMGLKGRKKMENEFDRNIVIKAYMEEMEELK